MPIVCKALEIESDGGGWRGGVSPWSILIWRNTCPIIAFNLIPECSGAWILLSTSENVHHSNEPHDPGNASEGRVDTEVQNYAVHHYFIYCEGPNLLSPNHEQDPATFERVEGVKKEKHLGIFP